MWTTFTPPQIHMGKHLLDFTSHRPRNDCKQDCNITFQCAMTYIRLQRSQPGQVFCFQCGVKVVQMLHVLQHQRVEEPSVTYGPVMIDGILAAPQRCPFCMVQGMFT